MFGPIQIKTRGAVGRDMIPVMNQAMKAAWLETGKEFATTYVPKRFTAAHATEANYLPRKGQNEARGSKAFWKSYFGQKLRRTGHADPFVFSGESRRAARIARVTSTSKGATVRLRLPKLMQKNTAKFIPDFVRITAKESLELAAIYDRHLDARLNSPQ